jgi:6,7-dimethyl-8-ribityllumazine synthase
MTDQTSRFDPFEDTGDWPFRDAPPRDDDPPEDRPFFAGAAEPAAEPVELVEEVRLGSVGVGEEDEPVGESPAVEVVDDAEAVGDAEPVGDAESVGDAEPAPAAEAFEAPQPEDEPEVAEQPEEEEEDGEAAAVPAAAEHAPGDLVVPAGPSVLEGGPHGFRRSVAVVVSRFNGDVTSELLESAVVALRDCNVADDAITVVPVPGAFELPLAALALAKTRRFSCVVALGCVIRGETPHFELVAGEAASGLQLAAIETGIPVSFGVLACESKEQALERVDRGAEAARTALEMADLFSHVRTRAATA